MMTRYDKIIAGWIVLIGLAEIANICGVVLGRSFSDCVVLFEVGILAFAVTLVFGLVFNLVKKKRDRNLNARDVGGTIRKMLSDKIVCISYIAFAIIILVQIFYIIIGGRVHVAGDMTLETVETILSSDTVYQINPMTGLAYELGMPLRLKVLCLSTMYAIICRMLSLPAMTVVWVIMPVIHLLLCYIAYLSLADTLFGKDRLKKALFMLLIAILISFGDYAPGMEGFGLLYAGFKGTSVRMAILVPYIISAILRKRWICVLLCILAEACIVWTLYGMGACILLTAIFILIDLLLGLYVSKRTVPSEKGGTKV